MADDKIKALEKRLKELGSKPKDVAKSREKVEVLNELAKAFTRSEPVKAEEYARQALALAEKLNYKEGIAASYQSLGVSSRVQGNYHQALGYCSKALDISKEMGNKKGVANSHGNIGNIHAQQGDCKQALTHLLNALRVFEELGDKTAIASAYNSIGNVYGILGDRDRVLEYYLKTLSIREEIGNKMGIAISYGNVGLIYKELGDYDKALAYQLKALKLREELADSWGVAISYGNMGIIYEALSDYDKALSYLQGSLEILEKTADKDHITDACLHIGSIYIQQRRFDSAQEYLVRSLELSREIGARQKEMASCRRLSQLFDAQGNFKEALHYHKEYSRLNEEIFTDESAAKIAQMQVRYETEKKEVEAELYRLKTKDLEAEITERKRASEALRESEEKYRNIFEHSPAGIGIYQKGKVLFVNPAMLQMLGYESADEVVGRPVLEFIHPDYREQARKNIETVSSRKAERGEISETKLIRKDGSSLDVTEIAQYIIYDGKPAIQGYVLDNTERKRAEEALRESESELAVIFDNSPLMMILLDEETNILRVANKAAEITTGLTSGEIAGMRSGEAMRCIHHLDVPEGCGYGPFCQDCVVRNTVVDTLQTENPHHQVEADLYVAKGDEEEKLVFLVSSAIIDAYGKRRVLVTLQDVTERKRAAEALRESEERLRQTIENAHDLIYRTDLRGGMTFVNAVVIRMLGYSEEEFIGRNYLEFIQPDYRKDARRFYRLQFTKKILNTYYEFPAVAKDKRKVWLGQNVQLLMEGGKIAGFQAMAREITERKRAQEALRESEEKYRLLVGHNPEAIAVHSEGKLVYCNETGVKLLGAANVEELIGKPVFDFVHPDYREIVAERIRKSQEEGKFAEPIEEKFLRLDGEVIDVEVASIPITYQGKPANQVVIRDITDRKLAQEALVESEERYRDLFESANDLIQSVSSDGRFQYVNRAWRETLGYSEEELAGITLFDVIHPDCQAHCMEVFQQVIAGEDGRSVEVVFVAKDGKKVTVEGSVNCRFKEGKPVATRGIFRDITERKQASEVLAESEERYRTLQENVPVGVFRTTPQGEFLSANRALVNMLGYESDEEMVNVSVADVYVCPEQRQEYIKRMNEEGMVTDFEAQLRRKDGSVFWGSVNARAVLGKEGQVVHYDGILEDITERKRAEEALKESEERFRQMAELLPQTVYEIDLEGNVTYANRFGLELFGYTQADIDKGPNSLDLFIPEDRERARHHIERLLEGGKPYGEEYTVLRKDGSTFTAVMYSSLIIREEKPAGLRGVLVDITERKQAEEQIKRSLAEKEVLLKEIHHRVKNNLQVISSLLGLQMRRIKDEIMMKIFKNSQDRIHSMSLVHEKLYRSKSLARIDFASYVFELTDSLIETYALDPDAVTLEADIDDVSLNIDTVTSLGLIVNELISNSLKHAFPEGRRGRISISLKQDKKGNFTLVVADDGVGLPEEIDLTATHTLGLELVKLLVTQLRGNVEIEDRKGTEFVICFPNPDQTAFEQGKS